MFFSDSNLQIFFLVTLTLKDQVQRNFLCYSDNRLYIVTQIFKCNTEENDVVIYLDEVRGSGVKAYFVAS